MMEMIAVDSMIWIYNCDVHAPEHENVLLWLQGENKGGGVIEREQLLVNTVIVMEVIHNLRRKARLPPTPVYDYALKIVTLKNMTVAPLDRELLHLSMHAFERYYDYGIGGRDATILAAMIKWKAETIATHDENMLKITDFRRVDPTHRPPRTLEKGES